MTQVLPLLTIAEYVSTSVCRSVHYTVRARLWRLRCLSALHLFSEAFTIFKLLILGDRLPQLFDSDFRRTERFENSEVDILVCCVSTCRPL